MGFGTHGHSALELTPHDHKVHNNLGLLLSEAGRLTAAAAAFTHALALAPNEPMYHNNLVRAVVYITLGRGQGQG